MPLTLRCLITKRIRLKWYDDNFVKANSLQFARCLIAPSGINIDLIAFLLSTRSFWKPQLRVGFSLTGKINKFICASTSRVHKWLYVYQQKIHYLLYRCCSVLKKRKRAICESRFGYYKDCSACYLKWLKLK